MHKTLMNLCHSAFHKHKTHTHAQILASTHSHDGDARKERKFKNKIFDKNHFMNLKYL